MSAEHAQQMLQIIQQDETLREQIAVASSRDTALNQTVELGKQQGLNFTAEEFMRELEAQGISVADNGQLQSLSGTVSDELSKEDLDAVAGGFTINIQGLSQADLEKAARTFYYGHGGNCTQW